MIKIGLVTVAAWLIADLVCGFVHWLEDRYLDGMASFEFLHPPAADNALHHEDPQAMTRHSVWGNMRSAAVVAWPAAGALWLIGAPRLVVMAVFFASFGNAVHRFAHLPKSKVPRWIRVLQETGLFISPKHHATHHRSQETGKLIAKDRASIAYCPMTDWVNPVVDRVRLWSRLESIIGRVTGVKPIGG